MPAAWFINAWQQRTRDTSGQKWVTLAGLLIATVGFGACLLRFTSHPTTHESPRPYEHHERTIYSSSSVLDRLHCRSGDWNALPRTLPSLHEASRPERAVLGHERFLLGPLYRRDRWSCKLPTNHGCTTGGTLTGRRNRQSPAPCSTRALLAFFLLV
jgi:hypothetical protein